MVDGVKSNDMVGNCIICGRRMIVVMSRRNTRFQSIFICPQCDEKLRFIEAKEATMSLTAELESEG